MKQLSNDPRHDNSLMIGTRIYRGIRLVPDIRVTLSTAVPSSSGAVNLSTYCNSCVIHESPGRKPPGPKRVFFRVQLDECGYQQDECKLQNGHAGTGAVL